MRAQRLGHDADIGKEIVDIRHHAAHHAEPHMMVGIDEARHDDASDGVDHLSAIRLEIDAHRGDPTAVDQHVGRREIRNRVGSIVMMVPLLKRVRLFWLLMARALPVRCELPAAFIAPDVI